MTEAVIVSACRTPIGTARKGTLIDVSAFDLAKHAVAEALARSGVTADDVDDIVLGEVLQGGGDIARYAAIETGLVHVPGVAHNRHCASGMAAVQTAMLGGLPCTLFRDAILTHPTMAEGLNALFATIPAAPH